MDFYIMNVRNTIEICATIMAIFIWTAVVAVSYKGYERMDYIFVNAMCATGIVVIVSAILIFNIH